MSSETKLMYQLKITLDRIKPPIWRRVLVSGETTLEQLHTIIQIAMGWENYHLYDFSIDDGDDLPFSIHDFVKVGDNGEMQFLMPEDIETDNVEEAEKDDFTLNSFITSEKYKFGYEYDFGDGWKHTILVEKILPLDATKQLPLCTAGKRACPPEDCGGIWGYMHFLEAINDPNHPAYKLQREWYYGDDDEQQQYDAEAFDVDKVNKIFRDVFK